MAMGTSLQVVALTLTLTLIIVPLASANSDGDALYTLRRSLSDPDNVLQSWDPNLVNPCTWFHITCDQDNRVTRVDLGNSNLSGHLVPDLGKLERLQYLELYKNNIQGTIPVELGNLKNLISLDLYNNNISGTIPPALGKLKSLIFFIQRTIDFFQGIQGRKSMVLCTLPHQHIVECSVEGSQFSIFLSNNTTPTQRLNDNQLAGRIPRELAGISSLKVVDVSSNNLCGTIPTSGPFEHIPLNNFENNPQLEGPELRGLATYDTNCS